MLFSYKQRATATPVTCASRVVATPATWPQSRSAQPNRPQNIYTA